MNKGVSGSVWGVRVICGWGRDGRTLDFSLSSHSIVARSSFYIEGSRAQLETTHVKKTNTAKKA